MQKTCKISWKKFTIDAWEENFLDTISPIFDDIKYSVPTPWLCPTERMIRRLSFRNERSLFYRKCDLSGKQIVAQYPTNSIFKVYDKTLWYGDDWSAYEYGRNFDFWKSFFSQFQELMRSVPRMARVQQGNMENSEYCNRASDCKNCYLLYSSNGSEDSYYGSFLNFWYQCIDTTNVDTCEVMYECVDCYQCQRLFWSEECKNCSDSYFLKWCVGCKNCLFCTNLIQKEFCIKNTQYSPQEYKKLLSKTQFSHHDILNQLKKTFEQEKNHMFVKYFSGIKNEQVSGDHINESKNSFDVFDVILAEDCRYCQSLHNAKNCMDFCYWWQWNSWLYEVHASGRGCSNMLFCNESWDSNKNLIYCDQCMFSSDLLGCCGIKHGEKSIFNKSYSQKEYETLCGKIIHHMTHTGEWGEFFPHALSPFGYNETVAQDYFPIERDAAIKKQYNWRADDEISSYHGEYYSPLWIREYDEKEVGYEKAEKNIQACLDGIISCEKTGKPFKIIKPELAFYIENNIALPTLCPNARHEIRTQLRNPRILYQRICTECSKNIQTVFSPSRSEKILCESCFQKKIFL